MQEIVIGKDRASVAESIGKGGEGEIYLLKGNPGLAVKIYNSSLRSKRQNKVRAMVDEGLSLKTELVAYPRDIVTDYHGNFLGFAMRFLSGYRPLHELYSPKSRQRYFPNADYRFIVQAALNVARAVGKVHQTGCVIGDLNHSGVLVAKDATVALIDADSFQFSIKGKSYPCVVGVPDFTPPELHGKNLASVERTIDHDNFGLAVAIFHLLFMGRHPYAGCYDGPDISMADAISQNRFAFSLSRRAATRTTPPPGSLTLDMFPDVISCAFEKAFGLLPGARPTAMDWIHALKFLKGFLNHCNKVKTHYYSSKLGNCVWCRLTVNSGFEMFPDSTAHEFNIMPDTRGMEQVISDILAFRFPTVTDLFSATTITHGVSNLSPKNKKWNGCQALIGLLMMAGAVAGLLYATKAWILWIGLALWGWGTFSDSEASSEQLEQAFKDADEGVQLALNAFVKNNGMTEVVKVHSDLVDIITTYKSHGDDLERELRVMKSGRESRQRQTYLDSFSIRGANISGIGPARIATLMSFGIETAADVTENAVLRVPGFGNVMTRKLVAWRHEVQSKFKYQPKPNVQDLADERALRSRFAAERTKLELAIRNGLDTLRSAKTRLDALPAKVREDKPLMCAFTTRAQAEENLRRLGISIPVSTVGLKATPPPRSTPQTPKIAHGISLTPPLGTTSSRTPTCPHCGSTMRRRSGRFGRFWGCSHYPRCKGTRKI